MLREVIQKQYGKNRKIILRGDNSKEKALYFMKVHSHPYTVLNYLTKGGEVLLKEEEGDISIVIPWKSEKKEFKGRICEQEGKSYIEGSFYTLKLYLYYRMFFWSLILGGALWGGISLGWERIKNIFSLPIICILFFSLIFFFSFDMWLLSYHNKKYEQKIMDFIQQSLNDDF